MIFTYDRATPATQLYLYIPTCFASTLALAMTSHRRRRRSLFTCSAVRPGRLRIEVPTDRFALISSVGPLPCIDLRSGLDFSPRSSSVMDLASVDCQTTRKEEGKIRPSLAVEKWKKKGMK